MAKDLFTAAAVGIACAASQHSQEKHYQEIQKQMKIHDAKVFGTAASRNLAEMRERYPDQPLGYLFPNRMTSESWKEYYTKDQWLYRVHKPAFGIHLFVDRDIMGWNPAWGNISEEYQKWCAAMGIPPKERHLTSFFANPPHLKTAAEIIEERKQKEKEEEPMAILGIILIAIFIIAVICHM